ncbi:alpha/beta hydrolase [Porticoccaceae bacterium]|nr:alpha/beta hydrolase [Porticoccaceae bacterium]
MDCPEFEAAKMADMPVIRQCWAEFFYTTSMYKNMVKRYAVKMSPKTIGGVYTEIFTPSEGIREGNRGKVLINVHGGGFQYGSRSTSHLESIPIAAVGQIKVISIDYRMAPEYQFPAASEDVEKVYRELLKEYSAENIGLYGCSAGGMLTAQSVAWFLDKGLPLPAAVGMFCAAAANPWEGDSHFMGRAMVGDSDSFETNPYIKDASPKNSLVIPMVSQEIMKNFPPSLLISGTRDFTLGSIVKTHTDLNKLGVEADLFIWEGLSHAFHFNSEIPESREAYDVIVEFFDSHLGK